MSSDSNILRGVLDFFSSNTATHTISTSMANNESGEDDDDTEEDDVEEDNSRNTATSLAANAVAIAKSNSIVEGSIVDKTKKKYAQTLDYITRQCASICPDAVEDKGDGELTLAIPMSLLNIQIFFGVMGSERSDLTVKSKSAVPGYISAIKWGYRKAKIKIPDDQLQFFKSFTDGYKRVVATKKQSGVMKQHEGKVSY